MTMLSTQARGCDNCKHYRETPPEMYSPLVCRLCERGFTKWEPEDSTESDPSGIDAHTPGAKLDAGKPMASLLADFGLALLAVAEVATFGAKKYTVGGWQKVENGQQRYKDALWRHLLKEKHSATDPDSGLDHAAHAAWNALASLELKLREETA